VREWIVIIAAGGLGGIGGTCFAEQAAPISQEPDDDVLGLKGHIPEWVRNLLRWFWSLILNIFGGALASFILWATYTSSLSFSSHSFTPSEIAAAITVGFGGVSAVRGFMNVSQRSDSWKRTAEASADAAASFAGEN